MVMIGSNNCCMVMHTQANELTIDQCDRTICPGQQAASWPLDDSVVGRVQVDMIYLWPRQNIAMDALRPDGRVHTVVYDTYLTDSKWHVELIVISN